jgi:ABC-type nitrate/sulfonate/bicarbonate transport system substrate-binding protein
MISIITKGRRRTAVAVAALALLVASTGCAKRSSASSAGVLNVGQISDSVAFFPLFIAEQKGYFAKEGVKLGERPRLGTGAKVAAALKSGSIDLGAGVLTDCLNLSQIDNSTRLVANLVDRYYVDVVVGKGFSGPPASAPLDQRIRALRGKKIGITGPGSGTEALVTYLFNRVGMDSKKDAELVNLGNTSSAALGALKAHRVDALAFFQPIAQLAAASDIGVNYISPVRGDIPGLTHSAHGVVFTTQRVLDKKGKQVAAFQRAIARAEQDIHGDPAQLAPLLTAYLKGADPKAIAALPPILATEVPDGIGFTRSSFDAAIAFHKATGLIKTTPTYEQLVPQNLRSAG